jgi:hypothetical protein
MSGEQGKGGETAAKFFVDMANRLQRQVNKMKPGDDLRGVIIDALQMFKEYIGEHEKAQAPR